MIQVQHTADEFPENWNELSEEIQDSIKNGEIWSDTTWPNLEAARMSFPSSVFREITINS